MRYVLINHNTMKATASLNTTNNALRLSKKEQVVIIGRGTQLKGEVGTAWFAITDLVSFGTQPIERFGILIELPTNDQLANWMPRMCLQAQPKGCVYLQQGDDLFLHSVWEMKE